MTIMSTFILPTTLFILTYCGPGRVETQLQSSKKIPVPDFENSESVLQLAKNAYTTSFVGPTIIWKPKADIESMSTVLKASVTAKDLDYRSQKIYNNLSMLSEKISQKDTEINQLKDSFYPLLSEKTNHFFKQQDKGLLLKSADWISKQNLNHKKEFKKFCDAKLLDFAMSDLILTASFFKRPTPAAICENYYQEQGYFTEESCQTKEKGTNYFHCFFGTSAVFSEKSSIQVYNKNKEELNDREKSRLSRTIQEDQEWMKALPKNRNIIKKGLLRIQSNKYFIRFSSNKKDSVSNTLEQNALNNLFGGNDIYSLIQERSNGYNDSKIKYTFNDRLHNLHLVANDIKIVMTNENENALRSLSKTIPSLYGEELPNFRQELADNLDKLKKQKESLDSNKILIDKKLTGADKNWLTKKKEIATIIKNKQLAYAIFPNTTLDINISNDHIMTVKLNLESQQTPEESIGCYHLRDKKSVPYNEKTTRPMQVEFDQLTGKITLSSPFYPIENPNPPGFNVIKMTELINYSYVIELYPRTYKSLLKTFTGKIFIKKDNIEVYQGSLNLSVKREINS